MTPLGTVPSKPSNEADEVVYSNLTHILDEEVVEQLAHDQSLHALHTSKTYCGYVYATTEEISGRAVVMWYEEVWQFHRYRATYRGGILEQLILHVTDEWGYA